MLGKLRLEENALKEPGSVSHHDETDFSVNAGALDPSENGDRRSYVLAERPDFRDAFLTHIARFLEFDVGSSRPDSSRVTRRRKASGALRTDGPSIP